MYSTLKSIFNKEPIYIEVNGLDEGMVFPVTRGSAKNVMSGPQILRSINELLTYETQSLVDDPTKYKNLLNISNLLDGGDFVLNNGTMCFNYNAANVSFDDWPGKCRYQRAGVLPDLADVADHYVIMSCLI